MQLDHHPGIPPMQAPAGATAAAVEPPPGLVPSPLKPGKQLPVDDAIQSLLGLSEALSGEVSSPGRSAAGSPVSPETLLPAAGGRASAVASLLQQQQQQGVSVAAAGTVASQQHQQDRQEEEPAAPATIANTDCLAAAVVPGGGDAASQGEAAPAGKQQQQQRRRVAGSAEAAAAAALTAAADDESETAAGTAGAAAGAAGAAAAEDEGLDPDWQAAPSAKPKGRGRPRKRRPAGAAGAAAAAAAARQAQEGPLSCAHCGTGDTPRWWKDNFPLGTLCNACGIWLKRHGYPRPVQFFINPLTAAAAAAGGASKLAPAGAPPAAAPQQQQQQQQPEGGSSGGALEAAAPDPAEYYLINGRPKRRRTSGSSSAGATAGQAAVHNGAAGAAGEAGEAAGAAAAGTAAADPPINFGAAGSRVFVVRRKLIKAEGSAEPCAVLIHFGWSPAARAAHDMFEAVSRFGEQSAEVSVDDFELLSDCKATATLQARPGVTVASWDALVRLFVDSL